jgi:hypothetical protein
MSRRIVCSITSRIISSISHSGMSAAARGCSSSAILTRSLVLALLLTVAARTEAPGCLIFWLVEAAKAFALKIYPPLRRFGCIGNVLAVGES